MRPVITIAYDQNISELINSSTGVTTNVVTPAIYKKNEYEFDVTIYDDWPTLCNVASIATWKLGIGPLGTSSDPLVEANNAAFTVTNAAGGEITVIVNTHSTTLDTALGTSTLKTYYCEINGNDGTDNITIALLPVYCKNTVYE